MGAQEKSAVSSNSMQRVKFYRLDEDRKWDDRGTGHVSVDYMERSQEPGLFVIDEDDSQTLLRHRICPDDIYRKQEETIISWIDPEFSTEVALSFQESAGCSYIWDNICSAQRTLLFSNLNNDTFRSSNGEMRELPAVELSTLPLILKIVTEGGLTEQMHVTELILHDQEFFQRLMNLFKICEDLEDIESLHMLYKIIRGIIILNSQQIFEKIFGDELIMDVIGCLEYETEVPHAHHRNFLNEHVVFKEAIPIKDRIVLSKIHQTYRVGYIKDVILPRALDEATIATLNSMIHVNNATVVALLKDDSTFIQELFSRLRSPKTDVESKKKLVYFLHEFCTLSKSLQMVQQFRLFRELVNEGIIDIIIDILQSDDKRLVLTGTDILILFLNQDPNLLRSYVSRPEGMSLLGLLVQGMITDFGDDMHCQFLEILRCLLDSYTLSGSQRDTIVDIFYDKHLSQLIEVIISSCSMDSNDKKFSKAKPEILMNICDLLCFCVLHHPLKLKGNFLVNNVFDKVLLLTKRREKYLVVAAVWFFRTVISRNDDQLSNYIVKHNLLKYVIDVFVENGDRYNLLNSAVLDLLEYIRKENLKILIKYVMESFGDQLGKFEHLASIQAFKLRYDQALDNTGTSPSLALEDSRKKFDERAPEKEEEDYFNEDSDEEDAASASVSRTHQSPARPGLSNGSPAASPSLR
ncbi:Serine/threonine-protein phosphatase 4 regulatory subunit 3-like protein [Drosera capensis]